ncbi:DUF930 domain-containing protein [Rhizobium sp. CNPSo 3490]|uniref:DUF930 domain-containing protein n=1 Tax=Rhizobium sp. CNPSo 3490 TaxID=3021407 RepID=UPI0025503A7C|nr:DUF930 domain-containing protein [Rhizobium sp. CNPSo 3490]MDK4731127.1 DUF930 domain-containing protein [Rhizobium sp. CNPSo 3490]
MRLDAAGFKGHIAAVTDEVDLAETNHETAKRRPEIRWGIGVSVLLHVPVVALLIFGLPKIEPKPPEDESVKVELVPPPEEKKPEEKKAEEKPPEPKPPQEAKKEPPPPPPPPAKAAELEARGASRPQRTARPVFEFAEKDSAPEQRERGILRKAEAPKPSVVGVPHEASPVESPRLEKPEIPETMSAANPLPQDIDLPEVETAEANPEKNGPAATGRDEAKTNFEQAKPPINSTAAIPLLPPDAEAKESNKLTKAKTLFTDNFVSDRTVKTAMKNLPRQMRGGELCWTELREQLLHSSAAYDPNVIEVPKYNLPTGNILALKRSAFYDGKELHQLEFSCEVNDNATKVVSFEFGVGDVIPKSEWARYHYPGQ